MRRLASEHPDWIPVLEAALAVAGRSEPYGGEFAGTLVLKELESRAGRRQWIPNLRLLLTYGILQKSGETTRGGRRAYYRFVNRRATEEAVEDLNRAFYREPRPVPSFMGAGASSGEPREIARRSSERVTLGKPLTLPWSEFIRRLRKADAGLAHDLRELAPDTTDEIPISDS